MIFGFRNWVLENFPFLEDDFDALTDYELFCKVFEYIKNYQKEFARVEQEIKDFEEYISQIDIENIVYQVLSTALPENNERVLAIVNERIQALSNDIYDTIGNLTNVIDAAFGVVDNRLTSLENANIDVYNPTNGETEKLNKTLQDIVNLILSGSATSLTAYEFDSLELSATDFDAYEITALNFDLDAKEILV